jgi:hypothetical protein
MTLAAFHLPFLICRRRPNWGQWTPLRFPAAAMDLFRKRSFIPCVCRARKCPHRLFLDEGTILTVILILNLNP